MPWFCSEGAYAVVVREEATPQRAWKSTTGLHLLSLTPSTRVTCTCQYRKNSDTQARSPSSLGQAHDVHQEHSLPILNGLPSIASPAMRHWVPTPSTTPELHSMGSQTAVPHQLAMNCHQFCTGTVHDTLTVAVSSGSLYPALIKFKLQGTSQSLKCKN